MVGRRLGRFRIVAPLGEGGMSVVWRAEDELLGRAVAIKLLNQDMAREPEARKRFRREGEIAARLDHPGIVPVLEAGEADGLAYLVMSLIRGDTLSAVLRRRLLPMDEARRVVADAADALQYAHERGVIHRDVTARNIMITNEGRVVLLDFGLARARDRSRVTTSLRWMGTIAYMAPEVLDGREADAGSDQYSLGVVLYEALTGQRPFRGQREEEIAYAARNLELPSPSAARPEVPAWLDAVTRRALARAPEERHASMRDLARALRAGPAAASGPGESPARPTTPESLRPPPPPGPSVGPLAGEAPAYLAVFGVSLSDSDEERRLAGSLVGGINAALAELDRLHVVNDASRTGPGPGADLRAMGRALGANLILELRVRIEGTAVRVHHALFDSEGARQVAGGRVDGSTQRGLELEDLVVAQARVALGPVAGLGARTRSRPRDPAAHERYLQALSYLERYDNEASLDGAVATLEALIASEGGGAAVWAALARACVYRHRLTAEHYWEGRAAEACARAMAADPGAPETHLALGELHARAGRLIEALANLEQVPDEAACAHDARMARAQVLDELGRPAEAMAIADQTRVERPADWRAHYVTGILRFRHGDYAGAEESMRRVTDLVPDNAGGHRNLGSAMFRLERLPEAIEAYRRSIAIRPAAPSYYNLGTALYWQEDFAGAIAALEKAVALGPANPMAWGNLGNACLHVPGFEERKREALDRAIGLMQERLAHGPGEAIDWARLAGWESGLERHEEALRDVQTALRMPDATVEVHVHAAAVFAAADRLPEALAQIEAALKGGYPAAALRRRRSLDPLRGQPAFAALVGGPVAPPRSPPATRGGRT